MSGIHPTRARDGGRVQRRPYVQIDGTMVHQRHGGEMECKVGIIYGERAEVSRGRIALLDKRTYAVV